MRLTLLKHVLSDCLPHLINRGNANANGYIQISNWSEISDALYKLYEFEFIRADIQQIFDLGSGYQARTATFSIQQGKDFDSFKGHLNTVRAKCQAIVDLAVTSVDAAENQLEIQMPNVNDLTALSRDILELNKAFAQFPLCDEPIQITFNGVESGSTWLFITLTCIVSGVVVLTPVIKFIKACLECQTEIADIKNKNLEKRILELQLEKEVEEKIIRQNREIEQENLKKICTVQATKINPEKQLDNEGLERLVVCMSTMVGLLERGMEIYPSLSVKPEDRELLPKQKEIKSIATQNIKLLDSNLQHEE